MPGEFAAVERLVSPESVKLLFGVPTDYAGFRRDLGSLRKDFVPNCCPVWPCYLAQVVESAQRLFQVADRRGAHTQIDATLDTFAQACAAGPAAVILVSHWLDEQIELADRLHPVEDVVKSVPEAFDGVVDLCICVPEPLAVALRDFRPRCLVRFADVPVRPVVWFGFYEALLTCLGEDDLTYMEATKKVLGHFRELAPDTSSPRRRRQA